MTDNPQAFPLRRSAYDFTAGMTLRDWFAGQALASFRRPINAEEDARRAYHLADAMLAARKERP
jgi:hypothetical protein